ncbi:Conserved oligomeric Golgi complex subunit 1 [Taenia crassiceps]|uniref:Conserved oligomeric Golgi complex subunit 1 n=1 Tax=Taenia crassiceps TaxID=6207 RepID=A0ABR4Q9I3_9CEST
MLFTMEISVTEIFEKHTIDEIRRICVEIRNDIESKKMELRFLVGERHRDVIEASDNILHMKDFSHSKNLNSWRSAARMNLLPGQIHRRFLQYFDFCFCSLLKRQCSENPKKLVASQLKLLLDIPEMIWSALDEMDYTGAVQFFLLGRHLSVKMHLTGEAMAAHVNPRVLVKRQWAALDDIENTIASACRKQLALPIFSEEILAQALTALLVLEDQTMRIALDEFLSGRRTALSCIMGVDEASSGQMNIGVAQRLSMVVRLFTHSAEAVTKLFLFDGQIATLLEQMLKWCPRGTSWFSGENLFEYLPESIAYYHVTQTRVQAHQLKSPTSGQSKEKFDIQFSGIRAHPLSVEGLADPFKEWWLSTLSVSQQQLSTVLSSHFVNITDLVDTRHNLLSILPTSDQRDDSGSAPQILGDRVDLWTNFFQPPFLQHLEVLLKSTLNEVFTDFETALLSLAKSLDRMDDRSSQTSSDEMPTPFDAEQLLSESDLASFVWAQSSDSTGLSICYKEEQAQMSSLMDDLVDQLDICPHDLVMAYFACLVGRKDLLPRPSVIKEASNQLPGGGKMSGTVSTSRHEINLRRHLVTPQLRRICSIFNNRLCEIVATSASEDVSTWKVLLSAVEGLLERCCDLVRRVSNELLPRGGIFGAFCVARACFCLLDVYPALGATVVTATARMLADEAKNVSFIPWTDVSKLRQVWLSTSRSLRSSAAHLSLTAILRSTVKPPALENLFQSLSSPCNTSSSNHAKLVAVTSQWCEVMLRPSPQDTDSSAAVMTLKIPSHPSWPLQATLFTIARNLTTISVHTLPRGSLGEAFYQRLAEGLLNTYRRLVDDQESKLTQPQALQLLFDIRFILRLLVWPLTSAERRSSSANLPPVKDVTAIGQDLLKRLEAAVDPFDLEMSSEHLNVGIGNAVRSTAVLFAVLLPVSFTIAFEEQAGGSKAEEFNKVEFLSLIPSSEGMKGLEAGKVGKPPLFGLLPFSLSQVRPSPHVTHAIRKKTQLPLVSKGLSSTARGSSDFSWFGGLSFT